MWPQSERSPFASLADALEEMAALPARLDRIEHALSTGAVPQKRLMTVREAACLLSLSESTVYNLIRRGELKVRKIDSSTRVALTDLDAYVESLEGSE